MMPISSSLTTEAAKSRARSLQDRLRQQGVDIKLSLCYELLAVANGEPNWNVLSAKLPTERGTIEETWIRQIRKAVSGRDDSREIIASFQESAPVVIAGNEKPWGYPIPKDGVGLVISTARDRHKHGQMITFAVDAKGQLKISQGFGGTGSGFWRLGCFHPRSGEIRAAMRVQAMTMPGNGKAVSLKGPARLALENVLFERASNAIRDFARTYCPDLVALAEATACWDIESLSGALNRPDPVRLLNRAGRYQWLIGDILKNPNVDTVKAELLQQLEDDPHSAYLNWCLRDQRSAGQLPMPGNPPMPDFHGREILSALMLRTETRFFDGIAAQHPALELSNEEGLLGCMSYLMGFTNIGRPLDKGDLKGLPDAVANLEDALLGCFADERNERLPVDLALHREDFANTYGKHVHRAVNDIANPGFDDLRLVHGPDGWRHYSRSEVFGPGFMELARKIGVPGAMNFFAEALRVAHPAYRSDTSHSPMINEFASVPHMEDCVECLRAELARALTTGEAVPDNR